MRKQTAKYVALTLLVVLSFFAGRAEGWHEADVFMTDVARSLGVVVGK